MNRKEENRVKALRQQNGWSQLELARRSGVAQPTISFLEKGATRRPSVETVAKLALALGVTPDDILNDDDEAHD